MQVELQNKAPSSFRCRARISTMASNYHGGGYGSGRGRGRHHRFHRGGGRRGFRGSRSSDYGDGFGERRDYSDMAESGGYRRRGQHGGAAVAEDGNNFEEDRGRDGDRRGIKKFGLVLLRTIIKVSRRNRTP